MKKLIIFSILIFQFLFSTAQDKIVTTTGEEILAKVLEILPLEVKYKRFDNLEGPLYSLSKKDIVLITFENGTVETMNSLEENSTKTFSEKQQNFKQKDKIVNEITIPTINSEGQISINNQPANAQSLYTLGRADASRTYTGYKTPAALITAASVLAFGYSIIPTVAVVASKPNPTSFSITNQALRNNSQYMKGYADEAYRMKKGKVWKGFAIGTTVTLTVYVVLAVVVASAFN